MGKRWLAAALAAAMMLLPACAPAQGAQEEPASSAPQGDRAWAEQIIPSPLTQREQQLASIATNPKDLVVFDYTAAPVYSRVELVAERYEFGKRAIGGGGVTLHLDELDPPGGGEDEPCRGMLYWSVSHPADNEIGGTRHMYLMATDDSACARGIIPEPEYPEGMAVSWQRSETSRAVSGNMVLAAALFSSSGDLETLPAEFFDDPQGHMELLEKYDVAYLLRCGFLEEKPGGPDTDAG